MKETPRYPYLPEGKEILYVPIENKYMSLAKRIAQEESTDSNHQTGAVIVENDQILGLGANKTPLGHIKSFWRAHKKGFCMRKILKVKTGTKYWLCPGCGNFNNHAERRAIRDVQRKGFDLKGADLYLWGHWWCCNHCWDKMIEVGIRNVYLLDTSENDFKKG